MLEHQPTSSVSTAFLRFISPHLCQKRCKQKQADALVRVTAPLKHAQTHPGNTAHPHSSKCWKFCIGNCVALLDRAHRHKHTLDRDGWDLMSCGSLSFLFPSDCRTTSLPAAPRGCRTSSPQWTSSPVSPFSEWRYCPFIHLCKDACYVSGVQHICFKLT